ncbi:RNA polymerase sigma factor [Ammoniphilus resinae]|uniref:RNA polymerase sigma-70 factor (ECF subfamily) n=1 Tax=Ammoniphilus resinae TaxID=861532 RepID=A0ABS4GIS5_9BACL|nr:RNA polymerase sigma factor [Ammoniphilus resinae]MBP1930163.1 RNA polymerase sigma-70 factor (ECF subfamily) [Ammoniphilus resinae]
MGILDSFWKGNHQRQSLYEDLTDFYRNHHSIVYAYFFKVTGSVTDSEEFTQETFFQAVKSIHRFQGKCSLKTWLLQIARNVYRNKARTWARDKSVFASADIELCGDETLNPQRISQQKQARSEIQTILGQMPDDYRDVLILKEMEGLSHAEIAQILGKTPQTTKVLLHRAKQKFKDLYQNEVIYHEETM